MLHGGVYTRAVNVYRAFLDMGACMERVQACPDTDTCQTCPGHGDVSRRVLTRVYFIATDTPIHGGVS